MSSYKVTSYTASSTFTMEEEHSECLGVLAKYLFDEGFIDIVTRYNKDKDRMEKVYYIDVQRKEDEHGKVVPHRPAVKTESVQDHDNDDRTNMNYNSPANDEFKKKSFFKRIFS